MVFWKSNFKAVWIFICQFHPSLQISSIFLFGCQFKTDLAKELSAITIALSPGRLSSKLNGTLTLLICSKIFINSKTLVLFLCQD